MDVRCDFESEANRFAEREMNRLGYNWSGNSVLNSFQKYMNILLREVSLKPRKIFISKNLSCPKGYEKGLNDLVSKIEKGLNVNPYLSSNLFDSSYSDGLLNDFGLHHFHLGEEIITSGKSKGFIARTKPILIARITDKAAYLIGIYDHGKNGIPFLWSDQAVINIIHSEWPESIAEFKSTLFSEISYNPTSEQRSNLRKNNANAALVTPDGSIYSFIGGGVTSAGTNLKMHLDYKNFKRLSCYNLANLCRLICEEKSMGMIWPIRLKLLSLVNGYVFEDEINRYLYLIKLTDCEDFKCFRFFKGFFSDLHTTNFEPYPLAHAILYANYISGKN